MYDALKSVNSNLIVCAGALWKYENGGYGTGGVGTLNWIKRAYAAGLHGHFDAISLHLYNDPNSQTIANASWNFWYWAFVAQPENIRSVMNANGDSAKPIISTETGDTTGNTTSGENSVATIISHDFDHQQSGQVGSIAIYAMMNDDVSGFGLLRDDRSKRPAWSIFQQRTA